MFTRAVKSANERQVIQVLRQGRVVTKQELAEACGLSFPTAGKLVDELVEQGVVLEAGLETGAGGRRPMRYRFNEASAYALTLFFEDGTLCWAVADALGETVCSGSCGPEEGGYVSTILAVTERLRRAYPALAALAVGVPGGVADGRVLYIDRYDELAGRALRAELEEVCGLPTAVENNMRAAVYGMAARRGWLDRESVVCLHLTGNGPGCGVLVHGKPLSGFAGLVGEVGYLPGQGEETMQQAALQGLTGVDPVDYFARLVASACVFLNPEDLVVYETPYLQSGGQLKQACGRYLPAQAVPRIHISREYRQDYLAGLTRLAMDLLYPGGGLREPQERRRGNAQL